MDLDNVSLEKLKLWSPEAFKYFLSIRKLSVDGTFDELIARQTTKKKVERSPLDNFCFLAFQAASKGDVEKLHKLIVEHRFPGHELYDLREPITGDSLLHAAMTYKAGGCVRFLIVEAGCKLQCCNRSGETPFHTACMNDNVEGLKVALEVKENTKRLLNVTDMWKRTPLIKAMVYGSRSVVNMLLDLADDVLRVNAQDAYGLSAAHLASRYGQHNVLSKLVEKGANLNLLNDREQSPLTLAITAGNPDMVKHLLLLGAKTTPGSVYSTSPRLHRHAPASHPVLLAIGELKYHTINQCGGQEDSSCKRAEQVLHLMLDAHGLLLHLHEPDIFVRVLYTSNVGCYLPLLHKMYICSDSLYRDFCTDFSSQGDSTNLETPARHSSNNFPAPCYPLTLFDLARRCARQSLMASGHNVMWAVERLRQQSGCSVAMPPALLGLLLLKDCDRREFTVSVDTVRNVVSLSQ